MKSSQHAAQAAVCRSPRGIPRSCTVVSTAAVGPDHRACVCCGGRWRAAALLAGAAAAALVVAVAVVAQAPAAESWLALLQKRVGGASGWSRLPVGGVPTLWHHEPEHKATSSAAGWGRLPEHHKPRVRHRVAASAKHHVSLDHQLPAVYHLPPQPGGHQTVTKADRLAAEKLARNLHAYHKQVMAAPRGRAGQFVAKRLSAAKLRKEEKSLPPGFHILRPGQKLPRGAKVVKPEALASGYHVLRPGMKLPKGAKIVSPSSRLAAGHGFQNRARMNIPRVGPGNHMLDEEEGEEGAEGCECDEGDEECECAEPEPRPPPQVNVTEPTANERIAIADENHRASRIERIKARELKVSARTMEREGVTLIQSGWEKHKEAEDNIEAANAKMEEADAMVANANKVLDLANAHKSEALATKMDDIAEEFQTASEVRSPVDCDSLRVSTCVGANASVMLSSEPFLPRDSFFLFHSQFHMYSPQ